MNNLIRKSKKGDIDAFFQLIEKHKAPMYRACKSILNNEHDIADAMQEAVISAYKNIKSLKDEGYFKTWLTRILINKCKDIIAKNKEVLCLDDYIEASYTQEFLTEFELDELLGDLSKEQRLVISLYYISELNTREISEILREPEGTIKSRLSRAKGKVKATYLQREEMNNA
ncbi:sigma-70 family RNA polymerase sigma factor [Romboutsia weinsteinii]|uniref:Sigma-70 family RNA polymerase sigma factor n=1 Tax=Romboutsia weinsteinii TaxID=2020949 RepID=A0A371J335_9FIRM|nr:sigma-70 family RNA polymerase sigma factor [Romboutsia weinsteinii]RDY27078.1 sigma-70 family RNA polymerase sigma factor [Romboutsia weinsteinii]